MVSWAGRRDDDLLFKVLRRVNEWFLGRAEGITNGDVEYDVRSKLERQAYGIFAWF